MVDRNELRRQTVTLRCVRSGLRLSRQPKSSPATTCDYAASSAPSPRSEAWSVVGINRIHIAGWVGLEQCEWCRGCRHALDETVACRSHGKHDGGWAIGEDRVVSLGWKTFGQTKPMGIDCSYNAKWWTHRHGTVPVRAFDLD